MPKNHSDEWSGAWSARYETEKPARRLPRLSRRSKGGSRAGRYALLSAVVIAVVASPIAIAASGAIHGSSAQFTGDNSRYVELTRNTRTGDGGSSADACNSNTGNEACLNMVNKGNGWAASFRTRGLTAFRLQTSGSGTATPFLLDKNATGLVKYLNADTVDGLSADQIGREQFAQVTSTSTTPKLGNQNGATGATRAGTGDYRVAFANDVSKCTYQVTSADTAATTGRTFAAAIDPTNPKQVRVVERSAADTGTPATNDPADGDFQIVVNC